MKATNSLVNIMLLSIYFGRWGISFGGPVPFILQWTIDTFYDNIKLPISAPMRMKCVWLERLRRERRSLPRPAVHVVEYSLVKATISIVNLTSFRWHCSYLFLLL